MLTYLLQWFKSVQNFLSFVSDTVSIQVTQTSDIIFDCSVGFPLDSLRITYIFCESIIVLSALFISHSPSELLQKSHVAGLTDSVLYLAITHNDAE